MNMRDIMKLIEDMPMQGVIPAPELAKLLPGIDDLNSFTSALEKIENNQMATLTIIENKQLANAFISLLMLPDAQKTLVVQKLMPMFQKPQPPQQQQQPQTPQRL
jgi:hypothetical protein